MQNLIDDRRREQDRLDEIRRLRARELQLSRVVGGGSTSKPSDDKDVIITQLSIKAN
jgi:hypothetical protein